VVGKRVDAIRHSAPVGAISLALLSCLDIGVDLSGTGTDLFGRDVRGYVREISRSSWPGDSVRPAGCLRKAG
jgi:hypothetical protein